MVTPQLVACFEQALSLIKSAVESNSSKGAYLHGSFGSGKSHFMAVLTLLLQSNPEARSIPELADVVTGNNAWARKCKFLVVPYHMIGATSMESAILGHYADYIRRVHPTAPTPGFYRADALFDDARRLREKMGDEAFFAQLGTLSDGGDDWGSIGAGWDATGFDLALDSPPGSEDRTRLVGDLIDAFFESARGLAAYGISKIDEKSIDTSHDLDQHFMSLNPHLKLQPPVGAGFKDCLEHLFAQALEHQYPDHPRFEGEVKELTVRRLKLVSAFLLSRMVRDWLSLRRYPTRHLALISWREWLDVGSCTLTIGKWCARHSSRGGSILDFRCMAG